MAMITLSAIRPRVASRSGPNASSIEAATMVAPYSLALSRLNPTGSTATMVPAPASRAPWTAEAPIPPIPTTATVSPGWTPAA